MARASSEKVGRGVCPMHGCGDSVTYRRSSGGLLTWRCDGCDSSGYMDPSGGAYRRALETLKPEACAQGMAPAAPELPANRAIPEPAPARKTPKVAEAFNLGAL